jgi:hypothetical protein
MNGSLYLSKKGSIYLSAIGLEPGMAEISNSNAYNNDYSYSYKEEEEIPEYLKEQLVLVLTNIAVDYQRRMEEWRE